MRFSGAHAILSPLLSAPNPANRKKKQIPSIKKCGIDLLLNEFRIFDSNKVIIFEYKPNNLFTMKRLLIISTMLIISTVAFA